MTYNHGVLLAVFVAVLGMGAVAFYVGPPAAPAAQPVIEATPAPAVPTPVPAWVGLTTQTFGPVPRCADKLAADTVKGLLRGQMGDRALGLANVRIIGHSEDGGVVEWDCAAQVQLGRGSREIQYRITQLAVGRDLWEVAVSDPQAAAP